MVTAPLSNKQLVLRNRPEGGPITSSTFSVDTQSIQGNDTVQLSKLLDASKSQVVVRVEILSIDPSIRPSLDTKKSYRPPAPVDEVLWGMGLGTVLAVTENASTKTEEKWQVGDKIFGLLGFQDIAVIDLEQVAILLPCRKAWPAAAVKAGAAPFSPLENLAALSGAGLAAYLGLFEVGKLKKGDKVLISAAAGATGSLAVQMALHAGAEVTGVAGGQAKVNYVQSLGKVKCVDYKSAEFTKQLQQHAGEDGFDVFLDLVGGTVLDEAIPNMKRHGRIVVGGQIADYNAASAHGIRNSIYILTQALIVQGFIAIPQYWPQEVFFGAIPKIMEMVSSGAIKSTFQVYEKKGIENAVEAIQSIYAGGNTGKLLLQVTESNDFL